MDPYAPCPCGSGKKLKFCCQPIIGEMEKIERLQENNQPRMALQLLVRLQKDHPDHPWIVTHKALALIDDGQFAEAESELRRFLRKHPEHPLANMLFGISANNAHGFVEGKKAIHRAFRRGVKDHAELVAELATTVAAQLHNAGRYLGTRAHLAFALRVGDAEQRKQTFMAMVNFDEDAGIPYVLRGPHTPPAIEAENPELRAAADKAHRLSAFACWQEAAETLDQVADDHSANAALWHTIGLFRAWDGNDAGAAEALHRAAELHEDFETAVECETIAQLLDQYGDGHTRAMKVRRFPVDSVSRVLSLLDQADRTVRIGANAPNSPDESVAQYLVLDRERPESAADALTPESAPIIVGRVSVLDRSDELGTTAAAFVSALEGEQFDTAVSTFSDAVGAHVKTSDDDMEARDQTIGVVAEEQVGWFPNYYFAPKTPRANRRTLEQHFWDTLLAEGWPNTPQHALGGVSLKEAAATGVAPAKLAAAVNVFDIYCASRGYVVSVDDLRARWTVPAMPRITLQPGDNLNTLSSLQLRRVSTENLSKEQIHNILQRAVLIRHPSHLYGLLSELLDAGESKLSAREQEQACATLSDLCRDSLRHDEALQLVERGQKLTAGGEGGIEQALHWKMRELMLRIDDPHGEATSALLRELWEHFGTKIPELRSQLRELVATLEISPPWEGVVIASDISAHADDLQVATSSPADSKKLWLPGDG